VPGAVDEEPQGVSVLCLCFVLCACALCSGLCMCRLLVHCVCVCVLLFPLVNSTASFPGTTHASVYLSEQGQYAAPSQTHPHHYTPPSHKQSRDAI
jgi:hypothetical protein